MGTQREDAQPGMAIGRRLRRGSPLAKRRQRSINSRDPGVVRDQIAVQDRADIPAPMHGKVARDLAIAHVREISEAGALYGPGFAENVDLENVAAVPECRDR